MDILNQLSSKQGDKTEKSNKAVAELIIKKPDLIAHIATGLESKDKRLQSDCIEVFTMVSESNPQIIVPFAEKILPLLTNKETKIRWEAVHTMSYIADKVPEIVFSVLPELGELIQKDKSTIVRDYASDAISNFAKTGKEASEKSFIVLKTALAVWGEKHAKQVFKGFANILDFTPGYKAEMEKLVRPYLDAKKNVVVNEAKKVLKKMDK